MSDDSIFSKEEEVIRESEEILTSSGFRENSLAVHYAKLLERYKKLFSQTRRIIRMSDLMQMELNLLSEKLERLSTVDELTEIGNRRAFDDLFLKEWLRACRRTESISLLLIDIDYFKNYNDLHGHLEGDSCLRMVSGAIRSSLKRPEDFVARFGGEEFVVVLPSTNMDGALKVAEKIHLNVANLGIENPGSSVSGRVTVSIGAAATIPCRTADRMLLLGASDQALYKAKNQGRNRTCVNDIQASSASSL
jgi:diguanylate cyclase (GGDEF)-like protein